ncbi:hypothetical protein [Flavobacterium soyangense]|nr:hypothetical protein [Flavobacterium soyangense]
MPTKRIPFMGWTVNFANSNSVFLFVFIMLLLILFVEFMIGLKK